MGDQRIFGMFPDSDGKNQIIFDPSQAASKMRQEKEAGTGVPVDGIIFDLDDTLYPQSSGFSDHRNREVAINFMCEKLGFESRQAAIDLRNEYFRKYHSTLKGLTVAGQEGKLPKPFREEDLGDYFTENCNFEKFLKPNPHLAQQLKQLPLRKILFTNGPRRYGIRCIQALGLSEIFPEDHIVGVENVMPYCKPDPEAFTAILARAQLFSHRAIMVEDSMKNIRTAHSLKMRTILIDESLYTNLAGGEAALLDDVARADDPAVDVALASINDLYTALPELWHTPNPRFVPPPPHHK
uniref:Pyrimidine 5'-nucleotidase n=1 Tax=Aureoumbra lagunensis TaxID=44058 RepID=A0A7S3K5P8_9STRA